jgi:hypothetical protein
MAAFEVEGEFPEGLEVADFKALYAGLHTLPSSLMTARRSGLSAVRRRRRLRIFDDGALKVLYN